MEMLSNCSFHLTMWLSNSNFIMSSLPQSELPPKLNSFSERIGERVLGILWDINNDTLKLNLIAKGFSDTRRGVFSFFMFDFGSTGFFEFLFARNKVLIKDLCRKKLNWGNSLPSDLQKKWKYIQENFIQVYKIEVP